MKKMRFFQPEQFASKLSIIFDDLKSRVLAILPNCQVEHVGSSAIVGAISKGDLDVLVRVDKAAVEIAVKKIKSLGFSIKKNTLRTENLSMLVTDHYEKDVAIQIISRGSEFESFVEFRDIMNKSPALVKDYNSLKESCEGMSHDEYRFRKSQFVEAILNKARKKP